MALTEAENTLILSEGKSICLWITKSILSAMGNTGLKSDIEEQNDLAIRKQRYNSSDINKSAKD
ncbi:MAG: hypothetical protein ACTS8R_00325 [Arsenophonus sp. NC-QC1-MAG3]